MVVVGVVVVRVTSVLSLGLDAIKGGQTTLQVLEKLRGWPGLMRKD